MSKVTKEATDRISSRETISQPLKIVYPKNWIVFFTMVVLVAILAIWAFIGRIPTEITGKAVSLSSAGTFVVKSNTEGTLVLLNVFEGDRVEKDTPLGKIYNPELRSTLVKIEAAEYKIGRLETELVLLEQALKINQQLQGEGLIAELVVDESKAKVYNKQIEIEETKSELSALFSKLENVSAASSEAVQWAKKQLLDQTLSLEFQEIEDVLSTFLSPEAGTILEVQVDKGDHIENKETLMWVEHPVEQGKKEVFYSTVNADVIGRVEKGMRVLIEPLIVNPQEYGAIIGHVSSIYRYPVSEEELSQTIGNKQIVEFLIGKTPVATLLIVNPVQDQKTPSGFAWTSKDGPPFSIPTGSVATIKVVIDEQPPISYLVPLWKIKRPFQAKEPKE